MTNGIELFAPLKGPLPWKRTAAQMKQVASYHDEFRWIGAYPHRRHVASSKLNLCYDVRFSIT
jgi:hypothetical protein